MHSGIETEKYYFQMFSRSSDRKCSFEYSNFVLFRIIRIAEVYSEPSQISTMELFAKIVKGFQLFTIFIKSFISDMWISVDYRSI